eukprot:m.1469259 g.1469259  ORF g.1469259 m.1469259 type:complete len:1133 (-) comp25141_c0_seq3:2-3400(-)
MPPKVELDAAVSDGQSRTLPSWPKELTREWQQGSLQSVLHEFNDLVSSEEVCTTPFESNDTYWRIVELKFILRSLVHGSHKACESASFLGHASGTLVSTTIADSSAVKDNTLRVLSAVESMESCRLDAYEAAGNVVPRLVRMARRYDLNAKELDMFQLLTLMLTASSIAFQTQLSYYLSDSQSSTLYTELCRLCKLDLENFFSDDRLHVKDGVLLVDTNYDNEKLPRIKPETALAIRGGVLERKDQLKLAGTPLLEIVQDDEGLGNQEAQAHRVNSSLTESDASALPIPVDDGTMSTSQETLEMILCSSKDITATTAKESSAKTEKTSDIVSVEPGHGVLDTTSDLHAMDAPSAQGLVSAAVSTPDETSSDEQPYDTSLDFLDDYFQLILEQIKLSRERLKREMKEAVGDDDIAPWDRETKGRRANMREFEAKLRMIRTRIQHRLLLTHNAGLPVPRLNTLCQRLGLDEFEKMVVVLLIGHTVSPMMKEVLDSLAENGLNSNRYQGTERLTIKMLLHTFCSTFKEQVSKRTYFYKSASLVRRGIVKLPARHPTDMDLLNLPVVIDRRILDWVVGLDTEISELVEGSNLYAPTVQMEDVVLHAEQKADILAAVQSFQLLKVYQRKHHTPGILQVGRTYTRGLVLLFSGPSGTGKTLTANALASHLDMKVLLVNFNTVLQTESGTSSTGSLQSLFREAEIHNAVLFFDECESLFAQRGRGGSTQLTTLLTEIERHTGIIFLATNRPYDLDEAMYRRITKSFEFKPPNHKERERIWAIHTAEAGVPLSSDIDWKEIAIRYELSGGYIKNAVLSALLLAISRDGPDHPKVSHDDIVNGCTAQMRGTLKMHSFNDRVVPTGGLDELILADKLAADLREIIALEKARGILFGQWGFDDKMRAQQSTTVLFSGATGTGKSLAAEAIGYETGRPLKVLNFSSLMTTANSGGGHSENDESIVKSVFKDAALMNAVIVLDGFQPPRQNEGVMDRAQLVFHELIHEMERYNGCVVLIITSDVSISMYLHRLEPDFVRRFKFLVQFDNPTSDQRAKLWRSIIPCKVPLAEDVDFVELGRRYDLTGGQISRVVYRAAAQAALRTDGADGADKGAQLCHYDLTTAAKMEEEKTKGEVANMIAQLFA